MSLHISHHTRRTLAASDTQSPMDPTHKHNTTAKNRRNPPPVDHPSADPSSTIQNISQRISKLYSNNKKHDVANSFKPRINLHPQREPHAQTKPITLSPLSDTSCTTLTKSSSQNETRLSLVKKDRYFISSKAPKTQSFVEFDVDKASKLLSKSMDSGNEEIKKKNKKMLQVHQPQGLESRRTSASSMVVVNGVGRRRSFHNSQVELADFLSCNGVRVVAVDMPPFMQIHAVDCARKAHDSLEKFTSKTLALTLKKEFDGVYGPAWHCIVGTSFGSFVTHSVGGFVYFSMDHKLYILLFKTTVQRAE